MSIKLSTRLLSCAVGGAAVALGVAFAASAQPLPGDSDTYMKHWGNFSYADSNSGSDTKNWGSVPYAASDYAADTSATVGGVGGLTVYASPRHERSFSGAPIETVRVSRIVPIADLDLSTRDGVHELHRRVERAANDACDELDRMPGMIPVDGSNDCQHDAVHRAMDAAPIGYRDNDDAY